MKKDIPYAAPWVTEEDIEAVAEVLRSGWLTTGPKVPELEAAFEAYVGCAEAVAVGSGTAALHSVYRYLDLKPGDEVLLPTMTFLATANAVVFAGGTPRFVDVDPDTLCLDLSDLENKISDRTKAVVGVDYGGFPLDYENLRTICDRHHLPLIADSCHALGGSYQNTKIGAQADFHTFSFHALKSISCGEGGMITTRDTEAAKYFRLFRNHGMTKTVQERSTHQSWEYFLETPGLNYRMSDMQAAMALSQMKRLDDGLERRHKVAQIYLEAFKGDRALRPLTMHHDTGIHAHHLFVIKLDGVLLGKRTEVFQALHEAGIKVNVHYKPVHTQPFYAHHFDADKNACPTAEAIYPQLLSLPIFSTITDEDVDRVIEVVRGICDLANG